jgi:hypothetical protein
MKTSGPAKPAAFKAHCEVALLPQAVRAAHPMDRSARLGQLAFGALYTIGRAVGQKSLKDEFNVVGSHWTPRRLPLRGGGICQGMTS